MEELVTSLRAVQRVQIPTSVQKKDIYYHPVSENDLVKLNQMDGLLFRLEREKYREVVKSPVYDDHRENRTRTVSPGNYSSSSAPLPPLPPRTPQAPAGPAAAPVFVPRADTREAYSYGGHSNSQHYDAYHSGSGGDGGRYYHSHGHSSMPPQYGYGAPIVPPRPHLQPQAPYGSSDGYYGNYGGHPHHLGHGGGMNYSGGGGGGSYNYGSYGGSRIEPAYASHSAPLPSAYPQPPPPAVPMSGVPYPRPPAGGDSSTKRGYEAHQSEQQDGKKQRASPY